jgi:hypothetical protein
MLGMSEMTLYRAIAAGEFPAVRIRGRLIIPARALDEMVDAALADGRAVDAADWVPGEPPTPSRRAAGDRGSAPVLPLLGFSAFLLAGSLVMRLPFGLLIAAAAVVTIAVTVVVGAVRRERRANAVWDADYEASQRFEATAWSYTAWDPDEFWSAG